jgi:phosphotransferase system enzyme I (PtsI)
MTAGQIPVVKDIIRRAHRKDAEKMVEQAMKLTTAEEIERYIRSEMERRFVSEPEA